MHELEKSKLVTNTPELSLANAVIFTPPEIYFCQQYFQVLNLLISELECRFNQPSTQPTQPTQNIQKLLMMSSNDSTVHLPDNFSELYGKDLDLNRLAVQLRVLTDLLRTANVELYDML